MIEKIPPKINLSAAISKTYGITSQHKVKTVDELAIGENQDSIYVAKVVAVIPKKFLPV